MKNEVAVSILVPVYNSEKYIRRFLESALNQSLEAIEIICVDNHSTDKTRNILEEYQRIAPNKLRIYTTDRHYETCAPGRNVALKYARGAYVFFCDSDDLIPPYSMEQMYTEAMRFDSELVCGWGKLAIEDDDGNVKFFDACKKNTQAASSETAIMSGCEWWLRLIKRDLFDRVGAIPTEYVFDDVAYLPILQSFARNIRFINAVVYYYFKRADSLCRLSYETCRTSVLAEKYALENCNKKYIEAVQYIVASRTKANLDNRWPFFDIFVEWAREQMEWLPNNRLVTGNKGLYSKIKWAASLTRDVLPNKIYINGFNTNVRENRIEELENSVFFDEHEVIVLSEENCDISTNEYVKTLYENRQYELVAHYFALKNIYERGGVFIHDRIRVLNYFSYYKYQNAFFAMLDKNTYSDSLYGSPARNEVIADLINTFSTKWDKQGKFISLSERIKMILTVKYDIPLDGKERLFGHRVSVISPDLSVVDTRFKSTTKRVLCEHDFSDLSEDADYVTLKRSTLETIINNANSIPISGSALKVQGNSFREKALEQELAEIKSSNLWKLMQKLKKIGDGPCGPGLKKVFHAFLDLKSKFTKK